MSSNNPRNLLILFLSMLLGVLTAHVNIEFFSTLSSVLASLFIKFLQLISMPIIFLAIVSTLLNMKNYNEVRFLGTKVFKYTFATTLTAACVAFVLFNLINPVKEAIIPTGKNIAQTNSYLTTVLHMFPDNIVGAFTENNVVGVALIAFMFGIAMLSLECKERIPVADFFSSLFKGFLKLASVLILVLPLAIWAFSTQFVHSLLTGTIEIHSIGKYIIVVLLANIIQGVIVLPTLLSINHISVSKLLKAVSPALLMAFISKSSSATLPLSLEAIENKTAIKSSVAKFSLPLCTVVNMNGCAAFIFTTVLFVSMSNGVNFSVFDMFVWIFLSTIAAIGNASVPMGCYFLASAFLVGMGQPLELMGLILPLYALLDMLETALNVWSDCVVTAVVDQQVDDEMLNRAHLG